MPKGTVDRRRADVLFAHIADIRRGWAGAQLPSAERQALFLRYAVDAPDDEIASIQGVTGRAVRYRLERAVGKLAAWLNGVEYIDGYTPERQEEA
jgi:hypothetical protein